MTQSNRKIIIGITGNSGSGKTTISEILGKMGGHAINADTVAHQVMAKGRKAYKKIVAAFGTEILDPSEEIDRKKLGSIVFSDEEKRTLLERIVHPIVREEIISQVEDADASFIAIDAVLLVEGGLNEVCDFVWLVTAEEDKRRKRIIFRDNLSRERADARMRNQRDVRPIGDIADVVIQNDGDLEDLEVQIEAALRNII